MGPGNPGRVGWLAAAVASAVSAAAIRHRSSRRDLRLSRSKVIFPESLDEACRALLGRAQSAISTDDAEHDWQQATRLSRLNDTYLDLVARTASDDYAAEEITGMTEQLAAAARTRSDRLHDADLAASTLVLPQTRLRPAGGARPAALTPSE